MKQIDNSSSGAEPSSSASHGDSSSIATLEEGLAYEVDDIVKLELTAEQMLQDEATLMMTYVADDAKHFLDDMKNGLEELEVAAGDLLLSVADPTSVEWEKNQWWANQPHDPPQVD